MYVERRGLWTC